jgi:hypothetical protein
MTTCDDIRRRMRARFDAGEPQDVDARAHAAGCPDCAALLARLDAVDALLAAPEAPVDTPPLLEDRIAAAVRDDALRPRRLLLAGAALAVALVAAAYAGRWVPLPLDETLASLRGLDWTGFRFDGIAFPRLAPGDWLATVTPPRILARLGTTTLWLLAGGGLAAVMGFNAWEAARFRRANAGRRGSRR